MPLRMVSNGDYSPTRGAHHACLCYLCCGSADVSLSALGGSLHQFTGTGVILGDLALQPEEEPGQLTLINHWNPHSFVIKNKQGKMNLGHMFSITQCFCSSLQGSISGSGFGPFLEDLVVFVQCPLDETRRMYIPSCNNPSRYRSVRGQEHRIVPLTIYNSTDSEINFDMTAVGSAGKPDYITVKVSLNMPTSDMEINA